MEGVEVRRGGPADLEVVQRLFPELGVPDAPPDLEAWDRFGEHRWVACVRGQVVAYAAGIVAGTEGELRQVVTDPAWRGRGLARALLEQVRHDWAALGVTTWALWVKPDNLAAIRLYERLGFALGALSAGLHLAADRIVPAAAPGGVCVAVDEAAAQRVVGEAGIPPCAEGAVVVALGPEEGASHLVYDPLFGGARAVRLSRADDAVVLLSHLAASRDLPAEGLKLLASDDDTAGELVRLGASVRVSARRMSGPLVASAGGGATRPRQR